MLPDFEDLAHDSFVVLDSLARGHFMKHFEHRQVGLY